MDKFESGIMCVWESPTEKSYKKLLRLLRGGFEATTEEWEEILHSYGAEESFQRAGEGNHDSASILNVAYEQIESCSKGEGIKDIRLFYDAIGKRIESIKVYLPTAEPEDRVGFAYEKGNFGFLAINLGEYTLFCDPSMWLQPTDSKQILYYPKADMCALPNVTGHFGERLIGKKITGISVKNDKRRIAPMTSLNCAIVDICIDDGAILRIMAASDTRSYICRRFKGRPLVRKDHSTPMVD